MVIVFLLVALMASIGFENRAVSFEDNNRSAGRFEKLDEEVCTIDDVINRHNTISNNIGGHRRTKFINSVFRMEKFHRRLSCIKYSQFSVV